MTIDPDEIFLDTYNLPAFDRQQFEGELERPIAKSTLYFLAAVFCVFGLLFSLRLFDLQVVQGEAFSERSETNTLRHAPIFSERGLIYDRQGTELAWNNPDRNYLPIPGFSHLLGYVAFPSEEEFAQGDYYPKELVGRDGAEKVYNDYLHGQTGVRIEEVDAFGDTLSDYLLRDSRPGESLYLSVDARVQEALHGFIKGLAEERGFSGGAAVLLDVETGELLALTSYPEYDSEILSRGEDGEKIRTWLNDEAKPFLNRTSLGLYTPGSVVKPIVAAAALSEKLIDPRKIIVSTGQLVLPNPFVPSQPSIFKDWKAHGEVDLRRALAVSSNVYFYTIGGGFADQEGLGIDRIDKYGKFFGLGEPTGVDLVAEARGLIPTPAWKKEVFPGDPWRIGDTYHTAIGQYGFQVTPLQMTRAIAAIANNGWLVRPTILAAGRNDNLSTEGSAEPLDSAVSRESLQIVREGMRLAVTEGTATGLNVSGVTVAAKTGTAELDESKSAVNSWVTGFFPYEHPRYAFTVVMERGKRSNNIGGVFVMRQLLDWFVVHAPEYLQSEKEKAIMPDNEK